MERITKTCDSCGKFNKLVSIDVKIFNQEVQPYDWKKFYRYTCKFCNLIQVEFCAPKKEAQLIGSNVKVEPEIPYPYEEIYDPVKKTTEPLTDYAIDFHEILADQSNLSDLANAEIN